MFEVGLGHPPVLDGDNGKAWVSRISSAGAGVVSSTLQPSGYQDGVNCRLPAGRAVRDVGSSPMNTGMKIGLLTAVPRASSTTSSARRYEPVGHRCCRRPGAEKQASTPAADSQTPRIYALDRQAHSSGGGPAAFRDVPGAFDSAANVRADFVDAVKRGERIVYTVRSFDDGHSW